MIGAVLLLIFIACIIIAWVEETSSGKKFYKKFDKFMTERFWW